jgi:hypothetical protein
VSILGMNHDDWVRIKRILILGAVGICVDTAYSWHDWRAAVINAAGALILTVVVLSKRRARRKAGAR